MTLPVLFINLLINTENALLLEITVSTAITRDTTLARVLLSFIMIYTWNPQSSLRNACSLAYLGGSCKWKVFLTHERSPSVFQLRHHNLPLLLGLLHPYSILITTHLQLLKRLILLLPLLLQSWPLVLILLSLSTTLTLKLCLLTYQFQK